jgi:hypothetical protein
MHVSARRGPDVSNAAYGCRAYRDDSLWALGICEGALRLERYHDKVSINIKYKHPASCVK